MTNITELFIQSLCICIASVITTAVLMGTAVVINLMVAFCIEKIQKIRREESKDEQN